MPLERRPSTPSKIDRRTFLRSSLLASAAGALAAQTAGASAQGAEKKPDTKKPQAAGRGEGRPNILLIITDQQHAGMMSCTGNPHVRTPAFDSLAAAGMRFERAYAANPVCVPSRFSMFTGRMPSEVGMRENHGLPGRRPVPDDILASAMGHLFRRAGYQTVYGGKTHWPRGMTVKTIGFEPLTPDQRDGLADAAARFLHRRHEKPFLLVTSFINPHDICYMAIDAYTRAIGKEVRGRHIERKRLAEALRLPEGVSREAFFADRCPPLPPNHAIPPGEPESIARLVGQRTFREWVRRNWSDDQWRLHRWAYARLTERVDAQVGRVLAALREAGLEERTLVVFVSDHGDHDGAHHLEHKSTLYEEASRVPFIVSHKGLTRAGHADREHLVSTGLDLVPTLCDAAGISPPEGLRGRSVLALAEGRSADPWRDDLVIESETGRMLRTGRYKYNLYDKGAHREQLIDIEKDPGEMVNLAAEAECRDVLNDHRRRLCRWVDETGNSVARPYVVRPA